MEGNKAKQLWVLMTISKEHQSHLLFGLSLWLNLSLSSHKFKMQMMEDWRKLLDKVNSCKSNKLEKKPKLHKQDNLHHKSHHFRLIRTLNYSTKTLRNRNILNQFNSHSPATCHQNL